MIPLAAFVGSVAVLGGGFLALFARRYRDWNVRQLQKNWVVPMWRCMGVFFLIAGVTGAWSIATVPPVAANKVPSTAPINSNVGPYAWTGEPVIKDEKSAILVARALRVAANPDDGGILSEAQWLTNCRAELKDGVWWVRYRGRPATMHSPHEGPEPGYCSGATVFYVGAKDGRYMGELFVD
jgi:hypothetical protein